MVIAKSLWGKLASLQALLLFASFNTDGSGTGLSCKVMHCQTTNNIENALWVFEIVSPGAGKSFDQEPHGRQQLSSGGQASLSIQDFSVRTRFQCLDLSTWLWQIVPLAQPQMTCFPLRKWFHQNQTCRSPARLHACASRAYLLRGGSVCVVHHGTLLSWWTFVWELMTLRSFLRKFFLVKPSGIIFQWSWHRLPTKSVCCLCSCPQFVKKSYHFWDVTRFPYSTLWNYAFHFEQ